MIAMLHMFPPGAAIVWLQSAIGENNVPIAFACAALAAAVFVLVFAITADPNDSAPHRSQLDQLLERREAIYENLRDLKFEFRAGKFAEKDYEETRQSLETEAAMVIAQIEQATLSPSLIARRAPASTQKAVR
jgi:uncharacterized membrane protein YhiD involved in acid resistance